MADKALRSHVGAELRRMRQSLDLHADRVAFQLGWSTSKISRIETGQLNVSLLDLATILDFYNQPEEVRAELLTLVVAGSGGDGAWLVRAGGASRRQSEVSAIETRVTRIRQYAHVAIPGQLQSSRYMEAIVALETGDPQQMMTRRQSRQQLLEEPGAPQYDAVLDARAFLRWPPSDESIVADQIDFLRRRSQLPNIAVRILPLGIDMHLIPWNHFIVYDFVADSPPVAFVETQAVDMYMSADQDVARYEAIFAQLWTYALESEETLDYIEWLLTAVEALTPYPRRRQ
jgi:transcriptional regulator with XRE-family HTH domain